MFNMSGPWFWVIIINNIIVMIFINSQGQATAAFEPGVAARDGELEKQWRYDSSVVPIAFETYGRLGTTSCSRLWDVITNIASTSFFLSFRNGRELLSKLKADVERALLSNIADITLLSFGHASATQAERRKRS